jgi:hypothetical protein
LVELLWFVQFHSGQPGGLKDLARELIWECPNVASMKSIVGRALTVDEFSELVSALQSLPSEARWEVLGEELASEFEYQYEGAFLNNISESPDPYRDHGLMQGLGSRIKKRLAELGEGEFVALCMRAGESGLPAFFTRLCSEPNGSLLKSSFWYCEQPIEALLSLMERRAELALAQVAPTRVFRAIYDALDYAWKCRQPVWIHGNPRIGKTAAVKAYCTAYPGRFRLVRVPCSDSDPDLVRAVATALQIQYGPGTPSWHLREGISWVLESAGIGLVFDEAQFLFPGRVTSRSTPSRMNWVRTEIVDRELPCALCTTPNSYAHAERKFRKLTSYPMEQWLGRWIYKPALPDLPNLEDLQAVGFRLLPGLAKGLLNELLGRALQHDGQLNASQAVAIRAGFIARCSGRQSPGPEDVRNAMDEMLPSALRRPALRPEKDANRPPPQSQPQRTRKPLASPLQEAGRSSPTAFDGRQIRPKPAEASAGADLVAECAGATSLEL